MVSSVGVVTRDVYYSWPLQDALIVWVLACSFSPGIPFQTFNLLNETQDKLTPALSLYHYLPSGQQDHRFVLTISRIAEQSQHRNILDTPLKQFSRLSLALLVSCMGVRPGFSIYISFIGHKNSIKFLFLPCENISKFSECPFKLWVRHSHSLTPQPKEVAGTSSLDSLSPKNLFHQSVLFNFFFFWSLFTSLIWLRGTGVMEQITFVNSAYGVCIGREYLFPL